MNTYSYLNDDRKKTILSKKIEYSHFKISNE